MKTLSIKAQDYALNSNLEQGFLRGSAWSNLYVPYKYELTNINTLSVCDQIKLYIQIYSFISVELSLFIGTHPNNTEAIEALLQINKELKKMIDYYEENFASLTTSTINKFDFYKGDKCVGI